MEELFNGHGLRITLEEIALPGGRTKQTSRVHLCDSVQILALPTETSVLLLREFRPLWNTYIWTLPSGKVDKETDTAEAAQRELREEAGYRAQQLDFYCKCNHWDKVNYTAYIYIARNLEKDPLPKDESESMEVHALPIADAITKVLTSPYVATTSAFALLRYAREQHL